MMTVTLSLPSVILGVMICLAAVALVILGSYYTGAWDNGYMEGYKVGYKVGKDGQTESCNRDHESDHSDTEKV